MKGRLIADFQYREIGRFWEKFGEAMRSKASIEYSPEELARRQEWERRRQQFNREMEERIAAEKAKRRVGRNQARE